MKIFLCLVVAVFAQTLGQERDWSNIREKWADFPSADYMPQHSPMPPMKRGTKDFRAVCGIPNSPQNRIVGGWEADVNEFPWMCALFISGGSFCSCSLIGDQWIVTAAHCADGAASFDIYLGTHNVRLANEPTRVVITSSDKYVHPNWNANTLAGDIALIKFPAPVEFNDNIRPICLPPSTDPNHSGDPVTLAGWGRPSDSISTISPVLRKTNSTVVPNADCSAIYGSIITGGIICTSVAEGHGTCNGDSGGPLSYINADGTFSQIGVTSFVASAGCEYGYPDGFTRMNGYLSWITAITGIITE
jgi:secreted trypsin-like serine protease